MVDEIYKLCKQFKKNEIKISNKQGDIDLLIQSNIDILKQIKRISSVDSTFYSLYESGWKVNK